MKKQIFKLIERCILFIHVSVITLTILMHKKIHCRQHSAFCFTFQENLRLLFWSYTYIRTILQACYNLLHHFSRCVSIIILTIFIHKKSITKYLQSLHYFSRHASFITLTIFIDKNAFLVAYNFYITFQDIFRSLLWPYSYIKRAA